MMKFWQKKEATQTKAEQAEKMPVEEVVPAEAAATPVEERLDFRENLRNLSEAMEIQRELGGQLAPEDVERITNMQLEDFRGFLSGQEVSIDVNGGKLVDEIESLLISLDKEKETEKKENNLVRRLANNPGVRAAFVTLMLFAKFAPEAKAASDTNIDRNNFEMANDISSSNSLETDGDTYHPDLAEFSEGEEGAKEKSGDAKPLDVKLDRAELPEGTLIKLEVANYFDTDSDRIPDEAAEEIKASFHSFLSSLDPNKLDDLDNWKLVVKGQSDERMTNRLGGNQQLTVDRIQAVTNIANSAIQSHEFDGWPEEKVQAIKAKTVKQEPFISETGPEKGTKYITDLMNPETGNHYTAAETEAIKKGDPEKYKSLLDDCRQVSFEIAVQESLSESIAAHSAFIVVKDISRSMDKNDAGGLTPTDKYLSEYFAGQTVDGPSEFQFAVFAGEGLIDLKKVDNFSSFADEIADKKVSGDGRKELAVGSAIEVLKQTQPKAWRDRPALGALGDSPYILITTDEALQDVTYNNVKEAIKISEEKNAEVIFGYCDDKGETLYSIDLKALEAKVEAKKAQVFADPKVESMLTDACSKDALKKMTALAGKKASDAEKIAEAKNESVNTYRARWLASKKHLDRLEAGTKTDDNLKRTERVQAEMTNIEDGARIILADAAALKTKAEAYRASIKSIKEGAEKFNKTGDKSVLLNPYFAELSLGGNDPMSIIVDRSEFKDELSLKRN
ncbi:MAG: hypothetical protein Q8Q67_02570 [bacterium]|nr:hypothetical protein [bacterium]